MKRKDFIPYTKSEKQVIEAILCIKPLAKRNSWHDKSIERLKSDGTLIKGPDNILAFKDDSTKKRVRKTIIKQDTWVVSRKRNNRIKPCSPSTIDRK